MFKTDYKIQSEDINYGGHVGNERALLFFQHGRIKYFESLGLSELDLGDGIGVIQKNAYVEYNKQLFLDDNITIAITDIKLSKSSFTVEYEIYNSDNFKVINGSTLLVCYDYNAKRIKKIPESFKAKVLASFPGDVQ